MVLGKRAPCTGSFAVPPPPAHTPGFAADALGGGGAPILSPLGPLLSSRQPEQPPGARAIDDSTRGAGTGRFMGGPLPHWPGSHLLQTVAIVAALPLSGPPPRPRFVGE